MLSPNDGRHVVLLPQDKQIMSLTGMDESQYRWFCRQAILHSKLRPGEPTNFLVIPFLIKLVIGVALTYAASLLAPKPRQQAAGQPDTKEVQGQTIVDGSRYTPKNGFDSVQNVVELGSTVPLVYANRQRVDGMSYGGLRVNTNLLWSQIYSVGGGQLLRAVFLVGEADVEGVDPTQFAIGNNIISGYDLERRQAGRICIYYSQDGGRLTAGDYIAGVDPGEDTGNAETDGGSDVFQVRGVNNAWTSDFCYTSTPNNQTKFGLYGFIGNNMPYRINHVLRPAVIAQTRADGELNCKGDGQQIAARQKQDYVFGGMVGLNRLNGTVVSGSQTLQVNDEVTLKLFADTDAQKVFTNLGGEVTSYDVGRAVSSRQRSIDEQISYGDLYRIGSALGICISRTEQPFASDIDQINAGSGTDVDAIFEIIRPGICDFYTGSTIKGSGGFAATEAAHLMQIAEANVSTERAGRIVEIGFRSQMQINISGLCNYVDGNTYTEIDNDACYNDLGQQAESANLLTFISGTTTTVELRYSFFRVAYRVAGTEDDYTEFNELFGIRSSTGVAVYNYMRFEFPTSNRWDLRITPISGWEIRRNIQPGELIVLDPRLNTSFARQSGNVVIRCSGEIVAREAESFYIFSHIASPVAGGTFVADDTAFFNGSDTPWMVDGWARLAEGFIYNEVTASTTQPEHEIVYINTITENQNPSTPSYDDLAIVGINIRSSKEISNLNQFSVYVNQGIGATSNFPEILYDLFTNDRYGTGKVLNPVQIDKDSFDLATQWAYDRHYFFDGAVSEKINIRTWAAEVSQNFLLDLLMRNGRFALQPVANFDGPETITGLFTAGNVIEDSFEMSYADEQDRIPPKVSVVWREEREISFNDGKGLFPVVREVTVREASTPEDAPIEKIDISEYCTSKRHAIDVGKWACRNRRLTTHTVSFKTVPTEATLDLGAVFKVGMETITYEQPANGAVSDTGEVTSWPPLNDGTYPVLLWDGKSTALQEVSLTISNGRSNSYASSVFCVRGTASNVQSYKAMMLGFDEEGNLDVEAIYFPTDSEGNSLLVAGWDDGLNWIIEGDES